MPTRPNIVKNFVFVFPEGITKWTAIELCKASKSLSDDKPFFDVQEIEENGKKLIKSTISKEGARPMFERLREWMETFISETYKMPIGATTFLAEKILNENPDLDVFYNIIGVSKYETNVIVVGNDRKVFVDNLNEEKEKYLFVDAPKILCLIILNKMSIKLERTDLTIISGGKDTLVVPKGPNAIKFYKEFYDLFTKYGTKEINSTGISDMDLFNLCKEIKTDKVYYSARNGKVILKGFSNELTSFYEEVNEKIKKIEDEREESEFKVEEDEENPEQPVEDGVEVVEVI